MMTEFNSKEYFTAERNFNLYVSPYMVVEGTHCYLSPDVPNDIKQMYKEAMYWTKKKKEWASVTGEHFR